MLERETGLGAAQWFTLVALSWGDGTSQGELSRMFELDPAQVTRTGQALERRGSSAGSATRRTGGWCGCT